MTRIETSHIKPLNGENYPRWKLEVSTALEAAELWGQCSGTTTKPWSSASDTEKAKWAKEDTMARGCILPLLDDRQIVHVSSHSTAKEIWDKLKKMYDDSSSLNKEETQSKFFGLKMKEDQSPVEGMEEIEKLATALASLGVAQADSSIISRVLTALPSKYENFILAWDSVSQTDKTRENLHMRLKKLESMEREKAASASGDGDTNTQNVAFAAGKEQHRHNGGKKKNEKAPKRKGNCNFCGKPGHWERECRQKAKDEGQNGGQKNGNHRNNQGGGGGGGGGGGQRNKNHHNKNNRGNDDDDVPDCRSHMTQSLKVNPSDLWICDSGASNHFTGHREWYTIYEKLSPPIPINQTDGSQVMAVGIGTVEVDAWINREWVSFALHDVMHIPNAANLFSEGVMDKQGYRIIKENRRTKFYKKGKLGPQAIMQENVYIMLFIPQQHKAMSTQVWHRRLGHINMEFIRQSVQKGAVLGINAAELKDEHIECHDCCMGKATKLPFPAQPKRTTAPREVIHADLSGRIPVRSIDGEEYFMVLKDDRTGFRYVTFLKKKSDAGRAIIHFFRFFKNQTGCNIKKFKTDSGGEFIGEELQTFFRNEGIIHAVAPAHNYEQLFTCLCEVEAVVNGRPLTFVNEDQDDLIPLTPAMFIQDITVTEFPEVAVLDGTGLRRQYAKLKMLRVQLRNRFESIT